MHTRALSDRLLPTAEAGLQATFSCIFQSISWLLPPYEQHIFVHDKSSLCFLGLTDLSIHKQRKTQASWVSATDSYGEKITSCTPAEFHATAMTSCANNLLMISWLSHTTLLKLLGPADLLYSTSRRSGPFFRNMLHNALFKLLFCLGWTIAMLSWQVFQPVLSNLYN